MTARKPALQLVREGNAGGHSAERLAGGLQLPVSPPDEPDCRQWFPAVRVPTVVQLRQVHDLVLIVGELVDVDDPDDREQLARAHQEQRVARDQDAARRRQQVNRRARGQCRHIWTNIVGQLRHQGLVARIDEPFLVDVCVTWAQLDAALRQIAAEGLSVPGQKGNPVRHPLLTVVNQLRVHLLAVGREFGLSALARDRLPNGRPDPDPNEGFD